MQFTKEELSKLKRMWKEDHPMENISDEQLLAIANKLIRITSLMYQPDDIEGMRR